MSVELVKTSTIIFSFVAAACQLSSTSGDQSGPISCARGTVKEDDLSEGELLLDDEDVVKIRLPDQESMTVRAKGRLSFPASQDDIDLYELRKEDGWHWVVAIAGGLFGRNVEIARVNFANYAPVNAFYYPATRRIIVSSILPSERGARPFWFWVFVHVPDDVTEITYDCVSYI